MDSLAEEVVDAINDISGRHEGHRAAHAKGTLLRGTFTGAGSGLTTAAHMGDGAVPVTARFSNGGGDPGIPDYAKEGRGLAVKFYLPDGSKTDVVALSLPCFFVRTPEDFLEFTRLRKPDPETGQPDFEKLGEWMGRHPEAKSGGRVLTPRPGVGDVRRIGVSGGDADRFGQLPEPIGCPALTRPGELHASSCQPEDLAHHRLLPSSG